MPGGGFHLLKMAQLFAEPILNSLLSGANVNCLCIHLSNPASANLADRIRLISEIKMKLFIINYLLIYESVVRTTDIYQIIALLKQKQSLMIYLDRSYNLVSRSWI